MREIIIRITDEGELIPLAELVRCKNCIHRDENCGMGEHKWCRVLKGSTSQDDWCSYGERRTCETEV